MSLLAYGRDAAHKDKEKICNRFAGAMLIPRQSLRAELGKKRHEITLNELIEIKNSYGISVQAIMCRAADLGIVPKAVSVRFWVLARQNKLEN